MFEVEITTPDVQRAVRRHATELLATTFHNAASRRLAEIGERRAGLASRVSAARRVDRVAAVDLARSDALLDLFARLRDNAGEAAEQRLTTLLPLLCGGPVRSLEFASNLFAARLEGRRVSEVRLLFVPEADRNRRVQMQDVATGEEKPVAPSAVRCYGDDGRSYFTWALNRLDLRSLILTAVSYLKTN